MDCLGKDDELMQIVWEKWGISAHYLGKWRFSADYVGTNY